MLLSNLLKMQLSYMRSFSYGKNAVACIYLLELTYRKLFFIRKGTTDSKDIQICVCLKGLLIFDKMIFKILRTNMEYFLLIQKTVNSL